MKTLQIPIVLDESTAPTGDAGVWALIHELAAGRGGKIEFAQGENDLRALGRLFHVMGRALELAAGCNGLPDTYRGLAATIKDEAHAPEVKAAIEGRYLGCASQGCGNLWEIKTKLDATNGHKYAQCPACKRGTTHQEAALMAEDVIGVSGAATKAAQGEGPPAAAARSASSWF